jgi:uncharacterized 2Fe-2S/4Fe-4S cluster protein (DUF4445 family)
MENQDIQTQINMLKASIDTLNQEVYRNNFSSHQDFNKFSNFTTRLKVPHYDSIPPVGEVGEIIEAGGALYICSSPNNYTLV